MACPDCGRHSVICGACGKCLQEHCACVETECLRCGKKLVQPLVETDLGLRLKMRECDACGGQMIANPRRG